MNPQGLSNISEKRSIVIKDRAPVKLVSVSKSLGVKIEHNLKWDDHIQMISKIVSSGTARIITITFSNCDACLRGELFQALNWDKLEQQRKVDLSTLMCKALNYETPEYLSSKFINRTNITPFII